jgi:hypothetical protein
LFVLYYLSRKTHEKCSEWITSTERSDYMLSMIFGFLKINTSSI